MNASPHPLLIGAGSTLTFATDQAPGLLHGGERWATELPPALVAEIEPWVSEAISALTARVAAPCFLLSGEPVPLGGLCDALRNRLADLLTPAFAEPMNGSADSSLEDQGPLRTSSALHSILCRTTSDWVTATTLFLNRLQSDADTLADFLGCDALPPIASVSAASSDPHPGGFGVLHLTFHGSAAVFYKSRPVTGEWLWYELLRMLAALDSTLPAPRARVLTTDAELSYGWIEAIPAANSESAHSISEQENYWRSAGGLLCLAQHTCLTDLHFGNLVGTSAGPAIVDAECLATPVTADAPDEAFAAALAALRATGLLPTDPLDVSGLFAKGGSPVPVCIPRWAVSAAGTFRLARLPAVLTTRTDAPMVSSPVAVLSYLSEGYRHAADLLIHARSALMDPTATWHQTLQRVHAPRLVLRNTLDYALIVSKSLHSAPWSTPILHRREIFQALPPSDARRAEAQALAAATIPHFHVLPKSRTLVDPAARPVARAFTRETPGSAVSRALDTLTPPHLRETLLPALCLAILQSRAL
ncbi:MAG: DUF4135 domain-containing protein [Acidobacteriaceae bacterium]